MWDVTQTGTDSNSSMCLAYNMQDANCRILERKCDNSSDFFCRDFIGVVDKRRVSSLIRTSVQGLSETS